VPTLAGKLRKRVEVQQLPVPQAQNPAWNEPTFGDWATVAVRWAWVQPVSGRELVYAQQLSAEATHQITLRYYAGLTARMRLKYTDDRTGAVRYFGVEYVKDADERHVYQQCVCRENAP